MPLTRRFFLVALLPVPINSLAQVQAPPRPVGSEQVHVNPGLDEGERERAVRAHRAHPIRPMRAARAASAQPHPAPSSPASPR